MGQYYACLTEDEKGKKIAWSLQTTKWAKLYKTDKDNSWGLYNGVKLMEHSWIGNSFMDSICYRLYKKPAKVAWVGDYADDFTWETWAGDIETRPDPKVLHKKAWNVKQRDIPCHKFNYHGKFLVNHSKQWVLDFDDYIKRCTMDGWCIHPLSLLTACGNGLGGGDFWNEYIGASSVGLWCWDKISIEDKKPEGYGLCEVEFMETR